MPKAFLKAIENGGKVITKQMSGGRYVHIVYPKGGGAPIAGEIHHKEKIRKR